MRISLSTAVLAGTCAALAALGGVTALTLTSVQHISEDSVGLQRARETQEELNRLWRLAAELDSSARACFIESGAPDPNLVRIFDGVKQEISVSLANLRQIIGENSTQEQRLAVLAPAISERIMKYDLALEFDASPADVRESRALALDVAGYAALRGQMRSATNSMKKSRPFVTNC